MGDRGNDVVWKFVENMAKTDFNDLPSDVVEITKKFILDSIGTALAGSSANGCKSIVDMVKARGGSKDATIWNYGGKVPLEVAAFVNSVMIHARDFDDTHDEAVVHTNTSILPATLALAEQRKKSGKDLLTGVILGVDLFCRMGLAMPVVSGWTRSSTLAYFASTLSLCKIGGFDLDKTLNALGIAYSQVAGNMQGLSEGSLSKRIQPAFGARGAVFSCLLADAGITGPANMLEGKYGFFNLYQNGNYDRKILLKDLGSHFEGKNLSMKPYPCCRGAHAALDLTLQIVKEQDIEVRNIESITFKVTKRIYDLAGKPFKIGSNPQVDAQFSIPYTVATAILKKGISLRDFEDSVVTQSPALGLVGKIRVVIDETMSEPRAFVPVTINLAMKDGRIISRKTTTLKGSPESPMSVDECIEKFKNCNECSVDPLRKDRVEEVIGLVLDMEHMEDVGQLSSLLS